MKRITAIIFVSAAFLIINPCYAQDSREAAKNEAVVEKVNDTGSVGTKDEQDVSALVNVMETSAGDSNTDSQDQKEQPSTTE